MASLPDGKRYRVPTETSMAEIIVSKSRFIATVGAADSVESARSFVENTRERWPDASHHVYAFRVGYGNSVTEGVSDDGEPNGTAGPPILSILRGADIGDIVVVVTRYFGGTKLGTGGLVRAYSEATKVALNQLKTAEKVSYTHLLVEVAYTNYNSVMQICEQHDVIKHAEDFTSNVLLDLYVPSAQVDTFSEDVKNATAGESIPIVI